MIVAGMIAYYLFAFALLVAVTYFAVRRNNRDGEAALQQYLENLKRYQDTPPMPPPLPPREAAEDDWDDEEDEWDDEEEAELDDLSAEELGPIAPLFRRAARQYRDNPADRERLVNSLTAALNATTQVS